MVFCPEHNCEVRNAKRSSETVEDLVEEAEPVCVNAIMNKMAAVLVLC